MGDQHDPGLTVSRRFYWTWLSVLLIGLGLAISGYLLYRSLLLVGAESVESLDICSEMFGAGCDDLLRRESSWFMGVPLAGWGLMYYVSLAVLLIMALALGASYDLEAQAGALLLSIAGAAISIALGISMLAGWSPFCPLCAIVHVVNVALVPVLKMSSGRPLTEFLAAIKGGVRYFVGRPTTRPTDAAWKVVGFVTVALVAVVIYQWVFAQAQIRRAATRTTVTEVLPEDLWKDYLAQPQHEVPIDTDNARLGPADAPAMLVIFSDFQCPACRQLAREVSDLASLFDRELGIVFKHYPLSTKCNPNVRKDLHPQSCPMAWAGQAALRQRKFWAFHDTAFTVDPEFDEAAIDEIGRQAGLDMEQFSEDWQSDWTEQQVQRDIELGARLEVPGTPTAFLNGRQVPKLTAHALEVLIHHELEEAGHGHADH